MINTLKKIPTFFNGYHVNGINELIGSAYDIERAPGIGGYVYLSLPYDAGTLSDSLCGAQIAIPVENTDNPIMYRQKYNSAWTAWKNI